MEKVIYDKPVNMNIKILSVFNKNKELEKVFTDKIGSNQIFYNSKENYVIYLKIYAKGNIGTIRIKLFAPEKILNTIEKEILSQINNLQNNNSEENK